MCKKALKMVRAILMLLLVSGGTAMADFLDQISSKKPMYGDALSKSDLKGKVILLEYWGKS